MIILTVVRFVREVFADVVALRRELKKRYPETLSEA
jgi:hypothetical protein